MPKTMNADLQQELGKKKESQIMSVTDLNVKKGEKELQMTDQEVYEEMKKRGLAVVAGVSLVGNNNNARNENKSVDPFGVKLGANDDILESIDNYHAA